MVRFLKCFFVLMIPTALSGATFPIASKIVLTRDEFVSSDTGRLYAVNTLGAIFGALVGGFFVLPVLGLSWGLVILSSINVVIGLVVLANSDFRFAFSPKHVALAVLVLASFVGTVFMPTPGEYALVRDVDELLFYSDGPESSVAVVRTSDEMLHMVVDGDVQAETEVKAQLHLRLLGHLAPLFHRDPKDALLVALRTGLVRGVC